MDCLNIKEGIQDVVQHSSTSIPLSHAFRPSGVSAKETCSGRRIGLSGGKTCCRTGSRHARFLQQNFRSAKIHRRLAASHRSLGLKQTPGSSKVCHGNSGIHQGGHTPFFLGGVLGSKGRILPRSGTSVNEEVPAISLSRADVAVPSSPVRTLACSLDIHHDSEGIPGSSPLAINLPPPISGRLGDSSPVQMGVRGTLENPHCSGSEDGVQVQLGEIGIDPQQGLCLCRLPISHRSEYSCALFRPNSQGHIPGVSFSEVPKTTGPHLSVSAGPPNFNREAGSFGETSFERAPARSPVSVETECRPGFYPHFYVRPGYPGPLVVAGARQSAPGFPYEAPHPVMPYFHRCLPRGMGGPLGFQGSFGPLVLNPQVLAHKPPRATGSLSGTQELGASGSEQESASRYRQFDSGLLYKQTGGDQVDHSLQASQTASALVSFPRSIPSGQTHSREAQCPGGQFVPSGPDSSFGMGSVPSGVREPLFPVGNTNGGPVRHSVEQQATELRVSHSGPPCLASGCSVHELGGSLWLRLPTHGDSSASNLKDCLSRVQGDPDCSGLAGQTVVPGPPGSPDRHPEVVTPQVELAETASVGSIPPVPGLAEPSRLVTVQQSLRQKGFSAAVSLRISQSNRDSTLAVYQSKWAIFSTWCGVRKVDPLEASAELVADFLLEKFDKGSAPSTLDGYRSAISRTVIHQSGVDLGADKDLSALLSNFHQSRPSSRNVCPDWDLASVLNCLMGPPFEPLDKAPLKLLTWKCIFLLALASGSRRSELHALEFSSISWSRNKEKVFLRPIPSFLAKTQLSSAPPTQFSIPALTPFLGPDLDKDALLCPVRALLQYLSRTKGSRGDRKLLFVSYKKGFKTEIKTATISSWIKKCILLCLDLENNVPQGPFKVKAHDVRALSASLAFNAHVPLERVMESCTWASSNTFTTFYLRDTALLQEHLSRLGPIVLAQTVTGRIEKRTGRHTKTK